MRKRRASCRAHLWLSGWGCAVWLFVQVAFGKGADACRTLDLLTMFRHLLPIRPVTLKPIWFNSVGYDSSQWEKKPLYAYYLQSNWWHFKHGTYLSPTVKSTSTGFSWLSLLDEMVIGPHLGETICRNCNRPQVLREVELCSFPFLAKKILNKKSRLKSDDVLLVCFCHECFFYSCTFFWELKSWCFDNIGFSNMLHSLPYKQHMQARLAHCSVVMNGAMHHKIIISPQCDFQIRPLWEISLLTLIMLLPLIIWN